MRLPLRESVGKQVNENLVRRTKSAPGATDKALCARCSTRMRTLTQTHKKIDKRRYDQLTVLDGVCREKEQEQGPEDNIVQILAEVGGLPCAQMPFRARKSRAESFEALQVF